MEFKCHRELVDYLADNIYHTDFINNHTRPQLAEMLRKLYPHTEQQCKRRQFAFTQMCKRRQCKHIEFWLNVHGIRCK